MQRFLSDLYKERWNWLEQGIKNFRQGLVRLDLMDSIKPQVLIGIYGPTQVGKTTLILKILGIRQEKYAELAKALRGGRPLGQSATVTATMYQQSFDNRFAIITPDGVHAAYSDIVKFRAGMKNLRLQAEGNLIDTTKPVVIKIPQYYFDDCLLTQRKHQVDVLDLPGDDSKDKRELEQVDKCLENFLPQCRVCILVEIFSSMQSLTQIQRSHVSRWPQLPRFFRIVFTRSITSFSIQDKIQSGEICSLETFFKEYKTEFVRCCDGVGSDIPIFPLEFGDSWESLKKSNLPVYLKASPWIKASFEALMDDLQTVRSPEHTVYQMRDLYGYIAEKSRRDIESVDGEIHKIQKLIEDKSKQIDDIEMEIAKLNSDLDLIDKSYKDLGEMKFAKLSLDKSKSLWCWSATTEHKVSWLKKQYFIEMDNINAYYVEKLAQWNHQASRFAKLHSIRFKQCSHRFGATIFPLQNKYRSDSYWRKKIFNKDCQECVYELDQQNETNFSDVICAIRESTFVLLEQLEQLMDERAYAKEERQQVQQLISLEINQHHEEIEEYTNKRIVLSNEWESDRDRLDSLDNFLMKTFLEEVRYIKKIVFSTNTSPLHKWLYHQFWNLVVSDGERIFKK